MNQLIIILLAMFLIDICVGVDTTVKRIPFLWKTDYHECEGRDSGNYSLIELTTRDPTCDRPGLPTSPNPLSVRATNHHLVRRLQDHQFSYIGLRQLATSVYPAGAYTSSDSVYLITSGTLEGRYLYEKIVYLDLSYLSVCSSVLGYSYVTTKSAEIFISDRLDLEVFISPTGGYDPFRRGCTTRCSGQGWIVGGGTINA